MASASGIYISQCQGEHFALALALRAWLRREMPGLRVQMDTEGPDMDLDARAEADPRVAGSALLLAMVGPFWLDSGSRWRLEADREREQVRADLEAALRLRKPIVLLRTGGAIVPPPHQLPPALRALAQGAAVSLAFDDPDVAMRPLHDAIQRLLPAYAAVALPAGDGSAVLHAGEHDDDAWPAWLGPALAGTVLALAAWWASRGA